jgi:hypothetical protein
MALVDGCRTRPGYTPSSAGFVLILVETTAHNVLFQRRTGLSLTWPFNESNV